LNEATGTVQWNKVSPSTFSVGDRNESSISLRVFGMQALTESTADFQHKKT